MARWEKEEGSPLPWRMVWRDAESTLNGLSCSLLPVVDWVVLVGIIEGFSPSLLMAGLGCGLFGVNLPCGVSGNSRT